MEKFQPSGISKRDYFRTELGVNQPAGIVTAVYANICSCK